VTYEIIGSLPPGATFNYTTGLLEWLWCPADDPYTDYAFDVKATVAGQFDVLHVVADYYALYTGEPQVAVSYPDSAAVVGNDEPWAVTPNSSDNQLKPSCREIMYSLHGVLHFTQPAHGALTASGFDCLLYTPATDFHGLDTFTYYWEYDRLDEYRNPIRCDTNTAIGQVQVGNWVDLVPQTSYDNDVHKSIMAVGDSETTTLTLQNPRGDGVPATGYWTLSFDRSVIRVYDSNGKEILPPPAGSWGQTGSTFLETIPGEKEVTLTVVGVSGGRTDLEAYWTTWACDHSDTPPWPVQYSPWHWSTYETVEFTGVGVDIYDINRGGNKITGLTSTIIVGQENHLIGVVTPSDLSVVVDPGWFIQVDSQGNDPIANYVQTTNYGIVTPFLPENLLSHAVDYFWIGRGDNLTVAYRVTIDGHCYGNETTFNVRRPSATLRSNTTIDVPAVDVDQDPRVGPGWNLPFGINLPWGDLAGINWHANVETSANENGTVAYTQLGNTDIHFVKSDNERIKVSSDGQLVLDNTPQYRDHLFPVDNDCSTSVSEDDSPSTRLTSYLQHVSRSDEFETYLMYKSDAAGSIWVTLCKLDWYWHGAAESHVNGEWFLVGATDGYSIDPLGVDSTHLPQWSRNVLSLPDTPE